MSLRVYFLYLDAILTVGIYSWSYCIFLEDIVMDQQGSILVQTVASRRIIRWILTRSPFVFRIQMG